MKIPVIRPVEKRDNKEIAVLIRSVLEELKAPKTGTAYADPELDSLFEVYQDPRSAYFILEKDKTILGGAGISKLKNYEGNICELQKMYFLPEARKLGLGSQMMEFCVAKAREFGYDSIYLETLENMTDAQNLYQKSGFRFLDIPLGDTGHDSCPVYMLKELK